MRLEEFIQKLYNAESSRELIRIPSGTPLQKEMISDLLLDGICLVDCSDMRASEIDPVEFEYIDFPEENLVLIKKNSGVLSWQVSDSPIYTRNQLFDCYEIIMLFHKLTAPKKYLELGVRKSPTLSAISLTDTTCFGVDTNADAKMDGIHFFPISTDVFFERNRETFDMVFIDACHNINFVTRDLENSLNVINHRGLILLHDTYPSEPAYFHPEHCEDAYKITKYIREKHYPENVRFITLPFGPGLTILRKIDQPASDDIG